MSFDPGGLRSDSPASSGRASPAHRFRPQPGEDGVTTKDKAYRRYSLAIERALASFDTAQQEWADYISFMSRLLKALQTHPPNSHAVPSSQLVATRLAQCLNPSLPSGVHQKALEVYAYLFAIVGPSNLARDLHIYFPGLASVLSFASLGVRPLFLALFEEHIACLDPSALRPALKSAILCLLPGLEDETSEDFDRVLQILDKLNGGSAAVPDSTSISFFWQCFFLATITNPSRRQGALSYLNRNLPKFTTQRAASPEQSLQTLSEVAQAALAPEPGLLIRCFAAGLTDKQILVQRGFLDLLVTHLPLDSAVLQHAVPQADLDRLVSAAVAVVSRRDMSLNRRLWTWFLGPEPKSEAESAKTPNIVSPGINTSQYQAAYFARHGLQSLTRSILVMLKQNTMIATERSQPFRTCLSLMDRWEVGGLLIPNVFIPLMCNVFEYDLAASRRDADEVIKSASNFFDGVESSLIWAKVIELATLAFETSAQPVKERLAHIRLCRFIIQHFNLREEEMILRHIPFAALYTMTLLNSSNIGKDGDDIKLIALEVVEALVSNIPTRAFSIASAGKKERRSKTLERNSHENRIFMLESIKKYYHDEQSSGGNEELPISAHMTAEHLLRQGSQLFLRTIQIPLSNSIIELELSTRTVCSLVRTVPGALGILEDVDLVSGMQKPMQVQSASQVSFPVLQAIATVLVSLQSTDSDSALLQPDELVRFQDSLVMLLWPHLDYSNPKYHVEVVRLLWQLNAMPGANRSIEASFTNLLTVIPNGDCARCSAGRKFIVLWTHSMQEKTAIGDKAQRGLPRRTSSYAGAVPAGNVIEDPAVVLARPLLVILDWLEDTGSEASAFVSSWLQQLPTLSTVFEILIYQIRDLSTSQRGPRTVLNSGRSGMMHDDRAECFFFLNHIRRIIQMASEHTWIILASDMVLPFSPSSDEAENEVVLQILIIQMCRRILGMADYQKLANGQDDVERLALDTIQLIVNGPFAAPLKELELEVDLLALLNTNLKHIQSQLQAAFLAAIAACLNLRSKNMPPAPMSPSERKLSRERRISSVPTMIKVSNEKDVIWEPPAPPAGLVDAIKLGFASANSREILDEWVKFLRNVLPVLVDTLFQHLISLVEIFCGQINASFESLRTTYTTAAFDATSPEPAVVGLLNGLEQILATAHDKLISEESKMPVAKSPEQPQSFFGNVSNMTSGLFAGEAEKQPTRSATANDRMAVLLCFQDTLKCCFRIWTWGVHGHQNSKQDSSSAASFAYTSLRLRKRALRVLENLFAAEALECLEILASLYCSPNSNEYDPGHVLELLNILNGSRPKYTAPAIFSAIYRRINADSSKDSVQTSYLTAIDLVGFLTEYVRSIEDDAMDEIWSDSMAFLRDILNNPLVYSQILPLLLSFVALIAEKVDNTNFGEQRRMRKELGDVFLRLLTATFTALGPSGFLQDSAQIALSKGRIASNGTNNPPRSQDFALVLAGVVSKLPVILNDNERISAATTSISTNVIGPAVRAKAFPRNMDRSFLELLSQVTRVSQGAKAWRKDVTDAFNEAKFFNINADLAQTYIVPILRQLAINDKERLPELLSRLTAPTSAGIVFGVGAASARQETDRKTQLNLRRIALLILASEADAFADRYRAIEEKLVELLTATPTSSPSTTIRAEIFMLLRALILRSSATYLSSFWPLLNTEVQNALLSVVPESQDVEVYDNASVLQACKVLDLLVTLNLDDFQLHEWLFVTDTIDAVYRPTPLSSHALADELAEALGSHSLMSPNQIQHQSPSSGKAKSFLEPILESLEDVEASEVKVLPSKDLATRVLQPFLGQLSILAFEAVYGMVECDIKACEEALLKDIFEESVDI